MSADYLIDCQVCGRLSWSSYGPACPVCVPPSSRAAARAVDVVGLLLLFGASALLMLLVVVNVGRWLLP